ncbi:5'-nucleotidase C-terminal domain-containing protein, partial [Kaarinaea lacus]
YTPGNWEFAYGPAVMRNRFLNLCRANPSWQFPGPGNNPGPGTPGVLCPVIPANARIMTDADGVPGVTQANFPTLASNVYNGGPYPLGAPFFNKRTFDAYKIFEKDGVKIGVIGITAAIIPQQPPVFGRTFRFTQGTEELPGLISELKSQVDIIVVQSELGLPQNVQIGREFPDVDVVLSAHSHELTVGAILAHEDGVEMVDPVKGLSNGQRKKLGNGAAIVVEAGEDLYVGRLDLSIESGEIVDFNWQAVPVDDDVVEDSYVAGLVAEQEDFFIYGDTDGDGQDEFKSHSFLPYAFCNAYTPGHFDPVERCGGNVVTGEVQRGLRLTDSLDVVVGETEVLLHRHNSLEGAMNNFIADAFLNVLGGSAQSAGPSSWAGMDVVSMTNGFRFDTVVLPTGTVLEPGQTFRDGRTVGEITQRDLWSYFPVPAALVAADYSGVTIEENLNSILANVFSPNPYIQRGGWYLGLSSNMSQQVDVVRLPGSTSGSRLLQTKVNGNLMDPSKRYIIASCYGHTFPIGRSCRAEGGANMMFAELNDGDAYDSGFNFVPPLATEGLINNNPGMGAVPGNRAAPDNYLNPVQALRLHLDDIGTITDAAYGHDVDHRVKHVNALSIVAGQYEADPDLPTSGMPGIVQPIEGYGPGFLKRGVIVSE